MSRVLASEDREAAIARLSAAFAHDALTLDEFEHRVAEVYRAATPAALARLVEDLPPEVISPAATDRGRAVAPEERVGARVAAIFGNVERAGRFVVPPHLELRAFVGNVELDLREAEFGPGVTEIAVRALFGNVEVRLPAHVAVENHGRGVLASFVARVRDGARAGGKDSARAAATIRITGRAVLANVEFESDPGEGP